MTANRFAQAGRFTFGDLDLERAWRDLSADLRRHRPPLFEPQPVQAGQGALPRQAVAPLPFGALRSSAEAQLYDYLESVRAASQGQRPSPLAALTERLGELTGQAPADSARGGSPSAASAQAEETPAQSQLQWFDEKFAELRALVTSRESETRELVSINERLAEIIERVDTLAKSLPGEPAIQNIETQLANLAVTLDSMRAAQRDGSDEVRKAAHAVNDAAGRIENSRIAVEASAQAALERVAQASEAAQSKSVITAEQITEALRRAIPESNVSRLENELRALNAHTRETGHRTAETLERVHDTLRDFLHKVERPARRPAPPMAQPLKRLGVHMPITAGAQNFARSAKGFGSASAAGSEHHLQTLISRDDRGRPHPAEPMPLLPEMEVDDPKRPASPIPAFLRKTHAFEGDRSAEARQRPVRSRLMIDSDPSVPLIGIGLVVAILILASAALVYLHVTSTGPLPGSAASTPRVSSHSSTGALFMAATLRADDPDRAGTNNGPSPATLWDTMLTQPAHLMQASAQPPESAWTPHGQAEPAALASVNPAALPSDDVQKLAVAASRGDRDAQYRIARRFLADATIRSNDEAAARWLARAAENGHVEAQYLLGSLYEQGLGVGKDDTEALAWYRRAAEGGHLKAMHNLGVLYTGQHAVAPDYQRASEWFSRAAAHGVSDSQFNLAILYENGLGVERSERLAYFWYEIAGLSGDHEAKVQAQRLRRALTQEALVKMDAEIAAWKPAPSAPRSEAFGERSASPS